MLLQYSNTFVITGVLIVLFYVAYIHLCTILEENITAIKGFGYQIKAKGRLKDSSIFIPYAIVQHIFLNEVIIKNRVIFLATFLTKNEKGEDKLVPLFTSTVPKLDCLKILYQELVTLHK
ncbi:hypothetical protein GWI33_012459 [Rhynchophorus ferrugineus]|uniref:Phosphatidylinositol N-acetylglucosaminyltransferase subunit H conserved domain-containing protein n=1 Tax=Rhynchophorus ferrugineus TaxID=354439 RepID=A0A834I898_RHYFE|nr:hypothetical protein GWI33_012459 [Rhynchophorus ferrugineus]